MFDVEGDLLATLLVQLVNGGGAGLVAFELWKKFAEWWPEVKDWPADALRAAVLGTCAVIGVGAFFVLGWLGALSWPTTPQSWATTLFAVVATAFTTSQLFHGGLKAKTRT
jgi:hypothetical protein